MSVVVTGAAGFLGAHLCDRFLSDDQEVVGLVGLLTGSPDNLALLTGDGMFSS